MTAPYLSDPDWLAGLARRLRPRPDATRTSPRGPRPDAWMYPAPPDMVDEQDMADLLASARQREPVTITAQAPSDVERVLARSQRGDATQATPRDPNALPFAEQLRRDIGDIVDLVNPVKAGQEAAEMFDAGRANLKYAVNPPYPSYASSYASRGEDALAGLGKIALTAAQMIPGIPKVSGKLAAAFGRETAAAELAAKFGSRAQPAMQKAYLAITGEHAPGASVWPSAANLPATAIDRLSSQSIRAQGHPDAIAQAFKLPQDFPTTAMGRWENAEGNVVTAPSDQIHWNSKGALLQPAVQDNALKTAIVHAVTRQQEGVGINTFERLPKGSRVADVTGLRYTHPDPAVLERIADEARKHGLDAINNGNAVVVGRFTENLTTAQPDPTGKVAKTLMSFGEQLPLSVPQSRKGTQEIGRLMTGLAMPPWAEEGSGSVSRWMMDNLNQRDVAALDGFTGANTPAKRYNVSSMLKKKNKLVQQFAAANNVAPREDHQMLMRILGDGVVGQDGTLYQGFAGLQSYLQKFAGRGLPVLAASTGLGSSALAEYFTGRRNPEQP